MAELGTVERARRERARAQEEAVRSSSLRASARQLVAHAAEQQRRTNASVAACGRRGAKAIFLAQIAPLARLGSELEQHATQQRVRRLVS
jgi:hypothetical protein